MMNSFQEEYPLTPHFVPYSQIYFFFSYRNESAKAGGELLLGGTDPTHFVGSLSYVPLSNETYWEFRMDKYVQVREETTKRDYGRFRVKVSVMKENV